MKQVLKCISKGLEIYDSENQRIFNQVLPADRQVSANYLRDYFVAYQMFRPMI